MRKVDVNMGLVTVIGTEQTDGTTDGQQAMLYTLRSTTERWPGHVDLCLNCLNRKTPHQWQKLVLGGWSLLSRPPFSITKGICRPVVVRTSRWVRAEHGRQTFCYVFFSKNKSLLVVTICRTQCTWCSSRANSYMSVGYTGPCTPLNPPLHYTSSSWLTEDGVTLSNHVLRWFVRCCPVNQISRH